ncbi:peroxidase family protein [Minwuia thermotolerans]|uniref:Heme peroxidase n=1 Tax=Minwuia thermotolerans TaxID=2056226 RepID=A0A2M9G7P0_9PROT|nr:peroxidase family protein [Minwuia thermotolerans]PJK31696.1 hypothetical protein CVT23_01215 [Minwuia thermotolerans]
MHSATGATSLRQHVCRHLQKRTKTGTEGSGPAVNPNIYIGVEKPDHPGEMDVARTMALFRLLSDRMEREYDWPDGIDRANPNIPSGYTYLAQMASHDLFMSDNSAPSLRDPATVKNVRGRPLMLETIYGRNPELDAVAFEHASDLRGPNAIHWPRTRFRLDGVSHEVDDWSRDTSRSPRRDIGRIRNVRFGEEYGCPLVADERNDDHAILSQMTALFQLAHNAAIDSIEWNDKPSDPLDSANNFATARAALTYVFRNIVRRDLLARLLDPLVRHHYERSDDPGRFILDPPEGSVLTPEFINAAYRMGHAMVRSSYEFAEGTRHNLPEVMRSTSFRVPRRTPLGVHWIVRWSRFFEFKGAHSLPQLSRRISPKYVAALHDKQMFPASDSPEPGGLPYRDLVRSAISDVMKIDALAQLIEKRAPELAEQLPWISDEEIRRSALRNWIGAADDEIVKEFVGNPPPGLYFLIEAAGAHKGERLGPMGSIVLAETFYRALEDHEEDRDLVQAAFEVFGYSVPATMGDLILWVEQHMRVDDRVFDMRSLPLI